MEERERERERFSKGFGFYLAAGEVRGSIQSVLCYSSYIFFSTEKHNKQNNPG